MTVRSEYSVIALQKLDLFVITVKDEKIKAYFVVLLVVTYHWCSLYSCACGLVVWIKEHSRFIKLC